MSARSPPSLDGEAGESGRNADPEGSGPHGLGATARIGGTDGAFVGVAVVALSAHPGASETYAVTMLGLAVVWGLALPMFGFFLWRRWRAVRRRRLFG